MPSNDFLTQSLSRGSGILPAIQQGFNVQKQQAAAQQVLNAKTQAAGLKRGAFLLDVQKEGRLNKQALFDQERGRAEASGKKIETLTNLVTSGQLGPSGLANAYNSDPNILKLFGVNSISYIGDSDNDSIFESDDGSLATFNKKTGDLRILDPTKAANKEVARKDIATYQSLNKNLTDEYGEMLSILTRAEGGGVLSVRDMVRMQNMKRRGQQVDSSKPEDVIEAVKERMEEIRSSLSTSQKRLDGLTVNFLDSTSIGKKESQSVNQPPLLSSGN